MLSEGMHLCSRYHKVVEHADVDQGQRLHQG